MSYHSNPLSTRQAPLKKLQIALVNAILNNKTYLLEVSYWITISVELFISLQFLTASGTQKQNRKSIWNSSSSAKTLLSNPGAKS